MRRQSECSPDIPGGHSDDGGAYVVPEKIGPARVVEESQGGVHAGPDVLRLAGALKLFALKVETDYWPFKSLPRACLNICDFFSLVLNDSDKIVRPFRAFDQLAKMKIENCCKILHARS